MVHGIMGNVIFDPGIDSVTGILIGTDPFYIRCYPEELHTERPPFRTIILINFIKILRMCKFCSIFVAELENSQHVTHNR